MSKDEIIQNLFDQIHAINDHYLSIIAIVLVLTTIAFSALMWLQLRASREQYDKMKAELENEMVTKYNLKQISTLSESADRKVKMSLSRILMDLALHEVNGKHKASDEVQRDWVNRLRSIEDSLGSDVLEENREDVAHALYAISKKMVGDESLKINDHNRQELNSIADRMDRKFEKSL